jgi:hypothetical protein
MIKFFKDDSKEPLNNVDENSSIDVLNKAMEKLRARLFTLAESSLPEGQANSFKKIVKDYTSETWNILTKLLSEKSKEDKNEDSE